MTNKADRHDTVKSGKGIAITLNKLNERSKSYPLIQKPIAGVLSEDSLASKSLPIIKITHILAPVALFDLSSIAVGAEFLFTILSSMEILVKEVALLGCAGFFLGVGYTLIQTYISCFNYYLDCFYKNKSLERTQKNIFTLITIIFGLFCSISLFISSVSYGLVLYDFDFLHYSHATYLVFAFSILAGLVNFIGSITHITYNLSKLKNKVDSEALESEELESESLEPCEEQQSNKSSITAIFIITQKIGWFFRVINFGFLLSASFSWYGFIVGSFLTILDIYDNAVFLLSCDLKKAQKFENSDAFDEFATRYLLASGFTICYTSGLVYMNLNYFAAHFLTTPYWINIPYSIVTASCGAVAGMIRRYQIFQNLKEAYSKNNEKCLNQLDRPESTNPKCNGL